MRRRWNVVLLTTLTMIFLLQATPVSSQEFPVDLEGGPYIDKLVYKFIPDEQRHLALQSGVVDMDIDPFDPANIPILDADPDLNLFQTLRNGYGMVSFDCTQNPTNISGFRRAFAYAFDKTEVTESVMDGYSQTHDSLVPDVNPFCIEDSLDWHYYDSRPDIGNNILDSLGFEINPVSGKRDLPNGDSFSIQIVHGESDILEQVAALCVSAFDMLHISASYTAPCNCDLNEEMTVWSRSFENFDLSWLANDFWSENADDRSINPNGFKNSTFDSWRNQLLYSLSFGDTFQAAAEMQRILHYNVPQLVVYQNILTQAYRNDEFDNHIEDSVQSISGPWTMLNIKQIGSSHGGTVAIGATPASMDFNFFTGSSRAAEHIMMNIHKALYTQTPYQEPYPQIAESVLIETHTINPLVLEGHTRYTFNIRNNLLWTDDFPVTADDVLFTFEYSLGSREYGNPAANDLNELFALYSPIPSKFVIEFSTESYWQMYAVAFDYILPKHIFQNLEFEDWDDWSQLFTEPEYIVSNGLFVFTDHDRGEFYELSTRYRWEDNYDPGYYYGIISPGNDVFTLTPSFTLRWEIQWMHSHYGNGFEQIDSGIKRGLTSPAYYPVSYTLLIDGEYYLSGSRYNRWDGWDYLEIQVNDDSLLPGQYNFTIITSSLTDTIIVTVALTPQSAMFLLGLSIPFVTIIFFQGVINYRRRKMPIRLVDGKYKISAPVLK